jgi:branched-chain amino acid aminotransferase
MLQKYNPKNDAIRIFIGDRLYPRSEAKVSVFDSSVQGGDAVWEGIRVYEEGVFMLEEHLDRLENSAKTMLFEGIPSRDSIKNAIKATLDANGMTDDTHIRLTLTRGEKVTSGMDPRLNTKGCTLIVLAEWKPPVYDNRSGVKVRTSSIRRNSPMHLDSKIHHNNLINNILAKIEANLSQADDALMLDNLGFVAEMNGTNIFFVKNGAVLTPTADACLPGITRATVIKLAREAGLEVIEKNISLTEAYTCDECFGTGSMGELTPVVEIDGRLIGNPNDYSIFQQLETRFESIREEHCVKL